MAVISLTDISDMITFTALTVISSVLVSVFAGKKRLLYLVGTLLRY